MPKLFLSISISAFVDTKTGKIKASHMDFIKDVVASLSEYGFEVLCGPSSDQSAYQDNSTKGIVALDLEQIRNSTILLALITSSDVSAGQQFELGYASGLGKKVFIAAPKNTKLVFMNQGMVDLDLIKHLPYTDIKELPQEIMKYV